jgi:chaperone required for assembly of F1-ATPase
MTDSGPLGAAQRLARPELRRRFYDAVDVAPDAYEFVVVLDSRPARTPAKRPLSVPTRLLAEAIAAEWQAQAEMIDPSTMPLTRLVNSALDGVVREADAVRREIQRYAGSDLLCYRAENPETLVARQAAAWDPVVAWAADSLGVHLVLARGVIHTAQPVAALAHVGVALAQVPPLRLAALHAITTLTGSALLALAVMKGRLSAEAAWAAAHVDEDWNTEQWGADEEAMERRGRRWAEMDAAARLLALSAAP